jgi:hypothetical protein
MKRRHAIALAAWTLLLAAGPVRAAGTALLIGNSDYEPKCHTDLPNVPTDVAMMGGKLATGGYAVVTVADRNGVEMLTDVESNVPAAPDKYIVYYSGHGEVAVQGALLGPDCTRMTADDIVIAVDLASPRTLLILDSCASGSLADAVNALDPAFCTIASTTGSACGTPGVFTPCFVLGLEGPADANTDGMITVAEAAAYAVANCGDGSTTPTWDGDCPDCVITMGSVSVEPTSWGSAKSRYR